MSFYQVSFFSPKPVEEDQRQLIQRAIARLSMDWVRFSHDSWFVFTHSSADKLYIALREVVRPDQQFFVAAIEVPASQGYLAAWIWRWFAFDRSQPDWLAQREKEFAPYFLPEFRPQPPIYWRLYTSTDPTNPDWVIIAGVEADRLRNLAAFPPEDSSVLVRTVSKTLPRVPATPILVDVLKPFRLEQENALPG